MPRFAPANGEEPRGVCVANPYAENMAISTRVTCRRPLIGLAAVVVACADGGASGAASTSDVTLSDADGHGSAGAGGSDAVDEIGTEMNDVDADEASRPSEEATPSGETGSDGAPDVAPTGASTEGRDDDATSNSGDEDDSGQQPADTSEEDPPAAEQPASADGGNLNTEDEPAIDETDPSTFTQEPQMAMPAVWQEHAVVALMGEVYVIGGFNPDATDRVVAYDPSTDAWREAASFPEALQHANAAAVGERMYVAGYYPGSSFSQISPRVYEYNPDADAWQRKSDMPMETARSSGCVASLDGRMYIFGGANSGAAIEASAYDPAEDAWEQLPPLSVPREHCVAAALGGRIIIASGRSGGLSSFVPSTWAFDPAGRTYEELAPIPTPRGGSAGAVLSGKLFIFGGEGNAATESGVFATVEAYDPLTDSWESYPDMPIPRHGFGAATVGDRIYLPGGATAQGFGAADDHSVAFFE